MPITPYFNNQGGLNVTDSPISMGDNQATGQSYNYDYQQTGAITKVLASSAINGSADTELLTQGLGIHHSVSTDSRTVIRAAGTRLQTFDTSAGTFTNLTDDTVSASTSFLSGTDTTQPVVFAPFNTTDGGTQLWMAGGGMSALQGYTGTNITSNGTPVPTGSVTPTVNTSAGGTFSSTGTYYYGFQFRKLGTQAYSNVTLDVAAVVVHTADTVTLPLTSITNIDTTRYDKIRIWRSAAGGSSGFTTGSIVATIASTSTTYTDTGTSTADSQNVPRAGNAVLDNSVLSTATYKYVTAFKRRLVTASNSTIFLSDLNKPESWPTANSITIPTGGPITALGVIGVPSEYTTGAAEYLCIWKERELWVLTGTSSDDWELLFVDRTGCPSQSLVVPFNGFISWLSYNGIYIWEGRGRPSRVSRPIQALFGSDGDLDKSKLSYGYACQYEKNNQVIWRVSHRTKGVNKLSIKMDTRLTTLAASQNLQNAEMDGVFITDTDSNSLYAIASFRASNLDEFILSGDDSGFVYKMYISTSAVSFDYETKPLDMGNPLVLKRFKRVLVYLERLTDNDLSLFYWADYRTRTEYQSKVSVSMKPLKGTLPALFDIAQWDLAYWDDYSPDISPIEFNLHSQENNAEGISLKLRFEQLEALAPVRIHGFAVEWDAIGNIPIPTQQVA